VARRLKRKAPVALRVNPDVDPKTHPYIATGLAESKFGVSPEEALRLYATAAKDPALHVKGVAMHIGSQLTDVAPYVDAIATLRELARKLAGQGIRIEHLDVGGGLGIPYDDEAPPHPDVWGAAVKKALRGFEGEVLLEPGRLLVGNAGVLVTRVLYTKRNGRRNFVVVDAAMNDLVRPSLYGAHHAIEPVGVPAAKGIVADVVGPVCESGDFLARRRRLPAPAEGDLLCIRSAGAYGFVMSSNYNSRPRAAEVLVAGDAALLARARETYEDLVRGEPAASPPTRLGRRRKSG
jgi:diaminopimelate decarboxylase